jgi:hypothetical protein
MYTEGAVALDRKAERAAMAANIVLYDRLAKRGI